MKKIRIDAGNRSYDIFIEAGILSGLGDFASERCSGRGALLVSDDKVFPLYGNTAVNSLKSAGFEVSVFAFESGEHSKSFETYKNIIEYAASSALSRDDIFIALGGGVVGDVTGFAASSYLRGIDFFHVPTTLLAMVDSSLGGKTAVNLDNGKNLAGAFWHPAGVFIDTETLKTLPEKFISDGAAEIIKYAMLCEPELLCSFLPQNIKNNAQELISKCVSIKNAYVQGDERDKNRRQFLNFGHTIAHAVEKLSGYSVSHGHAVAVGMSLITRTAKKSGIFKGDISKLDLALEAFSLPRFSKYSAREISDAAINDKKRRGDSISLVLPEEIGKCILYDIKTDELADFLAKAFEENTCDILLPPSELCGEIKVPVSKSYAQRYLICAALSQTATEIYFDCSALSDDINALINCLRAMGAQIEICANHIKIIPIMEKAKNYTLNCGESGAVFRFLLPLAAALNSGEFHVKTGESLKKRPNEKYLKLLENHACRFSSYNPPFSVSGTLECGKYILPGNISSQPISGLFLALSMLEGDSEIIIDGELQSSGYVDMTIHALSRFGVIIKKTGSGFYIRGGQNFISPKTIDAEGDWSNAAFWLCAGALSKKGISCKGLELDSLQKDREIVDILRSVGADISIRDGAVCVKNGSLNAIEIDASDIPDLVPPLSVVLSVAKGRSLIKNIKRLRYKESDRVNSLLTNLTALGARLEAQEDAIIIEGVSSLSGGEVNGFGDHRIVMAMAIASCASSGDITIKGCEAVKKSYPAFFKSFALLHDNDMN